MQSNVLIVEDSPEIRSGLQIALEGQGYRVRAAVDGREGIQIFREWRPDIALLDILMPRMSGIDVCTLIRHESDVPVIMFSGVNEGADVKLAIQRGATDYVLKDTGFKELLSRVSKHLKHRAADLLTTRSLATERDRIVPFAGESVSLGEQVASNKARKPSADLTGLKVQTVKVESPYEVPGVLEDLVIVAHSEPASLGLLTHIAARTGFEVIQAQTGREAIEALALRRPKLLVIGNVLTDMNCLAVVQAVANHSLGELMAIVLAVGRRSPELARRARYIGVHETVFKPWEDGRLDVAIRSALAETRGARTNINAA